MNNRLTGWILMTALSTSCASGDDGYALVDAERFLELRAEENHRVIDLRTPGEFADGHVEGALNIDFYAADFAKRIAELDRDATYLVYCRSGQRSRSGAMRMLEAGFSPVYDLRGGLLRNVSDLPIVR